MNSVPRFTGHQPDMQAIGLIHLGGKL